MANSHMQGNLMITLVCSVLIKNIYIKATYSQMYDICGTYLPMYHKQYDSFQHNIPILDMAHS